MEDTNTSKKKILVWMIVLFSLGFVGFISFAYWNNSKNSDVVSTNTKSSSAQSSSVQGQSASKNYSIADVSKHDSGKDCWLVINNNVYDVSSFLSEHPGGGSLIIPHCGQDATQAFATQDRGSRGGHSSNAKEMLSDYLIGTLATN